MFTWTKVSVSRDRVQFPPLCPWCLRTDLTFQIPVISEKGEEAGFGWTGRKFAHLRYDVPYCNSCGATIALLKKIGRPGMIIGAVAGVALGIFLDLGQYAFVAITVGLGLPPYLLGEYWRRGILLTHYDSLHAHFRIRRPEYAQEFRKLNRESPV